MQKIQYKSISQSARELITQVHGIRESYQPLSKLKDLNFYSEDELFYEDLSDAFVVRFEREDRWEAYQKFLKQHPTGSEILRVTDTVYTKSVA